MTRSKAGEPATSLADVTEVLARLTVDDARRLHVDGVALDPSPASAATHAEPLARAIYSRIYRRETTRTQIAAMAGLAGVAQIASDQMRDAFARALAAAGVEVTGARSDSHHRAWHFFELGEVEKGAPLTRVYFHLVPHGAVRLVSAFAREFARRRVGGHLKVLRHAGHYRRADAGVLYVPTDRWDAASRAVAALGADVREFVRPTTPLFTRRLAPGIALAEDPGGAESFGENRCRLVAESVLEELDATLSWPLRIDAVAARLSAKGVDPAALHLRARSFDRYAVAAPEALA